jgi:hypothetical protein
MVTVGASKSSSSIGGSSYPIAMIQRLPQKVF